MQPYQHPGLRAPGEVRQTDRLVRVLAHQAQRLDDHTRSGDQLDTQLAKTHGLQQRQFFVEAIEQILRVLTVVLLTTTGTGHPEHQVFVETAAEPDRGGAHSGGQPLRAVLFDLGLVDQPLVGLPVGQQNHP